ncbi:unnamed protein product [Arctia plantaginis]|uniref:Uncharacterized protein n=1 Tax=Arctia plantaginis TaxID=874455 RepID=A0A8S0YV58_ARCPL|nr:unnamed protein product [Arctia plantaginis]CAB3247442.1 unnamed protein product [Arctia plantaginis]
MKQRWLKAHKNKEFFEKNYSSWLGGTFEIPIETTHRQGRQSKSFADSSERSKRRKTEEIPSSVDHEVIVHAALVLLQSDGKRNASKVLKDITNSPTKASQYKKAYFKVDEAIPPLTPFEALKMFVEADLTSRQHEIIRATSKRHFHCYVPFVESEARVLPAEIGFTGNGFLRGNGPSKPN